MSDAGSTVAAHPGRHEKQLAGQVALVTGAARGLGAGIALALARAGAAVACADTSGAEETVRHIEQAGWERAESVELDVRDAASVRETINRVQQAQSRLDVVVNNAGVVQPVGDLADTSDATFDEVFSVNVAGVFYVCRAAARVMRAQRSGRIINIASQLGKLAWPGWGVYSASKHAAIGLTQALALELAPYGVRVNCICPGTMDTAMARAGFSAAAQERGVPVEDVLAEKAASIPLGRLGTPEDVGRMAVWLASEDASFTTGAALNLTGGEAVFF